MNPWIIIIDVMVPWGEIMTLMIGVDDNDKVNDGDNDND